MLPVGTGLLMLLMRIGLFDIVSKNWFLMLPMRIEFFDIASGNWAFNVANENWAFLYCQ